MLSTTHAQPPLTSRHIIIKNVCKTIFPISGKWLKKEWCDASVLQPVVIHFQLIPHACLIFDTDLSINSNVVILSSEIHLPSQYCFDNLAILI